ncbi:MAG: hypothetical protein P8N76_27495 [Pirellulaceae bacterium]|nr:hypothetical protein [Pirellulaceae bacterium]
MNQRTVQLIWVLLLFVSIPDSSVSGAERWSTEKVNAWYAKQPWFVGCNFSPSTAINQLEMWQADSFDPEAMERELSWAGGLGFNCVRVYLHDLLWKQDSAGFIQRIDRFLEIANKHEIQVMFVLLDGVWDPQPKLGKQPVPRPHVHNSGWVQSPGADLLGDAKRHDELRPYIYGVIRAFREDRRVIAWDLFNEPDNANTNAYGEQGAKTELENKAEMATQLLSKVFVWAREADPSQPLTAAVWLGPWPKHGEMSEIDRLMIDQSDLISFHNYGDLSHVEPRVKQLRRYNRPIFCTEYMARPTGSRFDPLLGYFKDQKIAAFNWGFVAGKTQTNYPWDSWQKRYTAEPKVWFHEILRADGSPYDPAEVRYIKKVTGAK